MNATTSVKNYQWLIVYELTWITSLIIFTAASLMKIYHVDFTKHTASVGQHSVFYSIVFLRQLLL